MWGVPIRSNLDYMLVYLLVKGAFGVLRTAALPLTINPTNKNGAEERIGRLRSVIRWVVAMRLLIVRSLTVESVHGCGPSDAVSSQSLRFGAVGVSICDIISVSKRRVAACRGG